MAKASVVRHRFRRAICRERKASRLLCVYCQRARDMTSVASLDPASLETYWILITNQVALPERPQQNPDIGDRGLLIAGLRSAMYGKGKHRGPCVLHVTLITARGRVHSLAMRCLRCCLAFPCGRCDSAMRVRSCSACTPT